MKFDTLFDTFCYMETRQSLLTMTVRAARTITYSAQQHQFYEFIYLH